METKTLNVLLDSQKLTVFDSAESLAEARSHAHKVLADSPKHNINEALDLYHNTLIDSIKKGLSKPAAV